MPANNNPLQSPPDTIAIGVTGHRFLHRLEELIPVIDAVLVRIEAKWLGAALTVISPLAEGSDRIVAMRVLRREHACLVVPLPLSEELYLQDFQTPSSRQEFIDLLARANKIVRFPEAAARPEGYVAAGQYMLANCDLLIALWDGEPARGDGGTADMVALARQQCLPIAWIYTHHNTLGTAQPPITESQGTVIFENF